MWKGHCVFAKLFQASLSGCWCKQEKLPSEFVDSMAQNQFLKPRMFRISSDHCIHRLLPQFRWNEPRIGETFDDESVTVLFCITAQNFGRADATAMVQ